MFLIAVRFGWALSVLLTICDGSLYFNGSSPLFATIEDNSLINSIGSGEYSIQTWFKVEDGVEDVSAFLSSRPCSCFQGFLWGYSLYGMQHSVWLQYGINRFTTGFYNDNQWYVNVAFFLFLINKYLLILLNNNRHHGFLTVGPSNGVVMYVDGGSVYSDSSWYEGYKSISSSSNIYIGYDNYSTVTQYAGYIDEIAIWDRELTKDEVNYLLYNSLIENTTLLNDNNLLHYYPLNELILNGQYVEDIVSGHNAYLGNSDSTTEYDPAFSTDEPLDYRMLLKQFFFLYFILVLLQLRSVMVHKD